VRPKVLSRHRHHLFRDVPQLDDIGVAAAGSARRGRAPPAIGGVQNSPSSVLAATTPSAWSLDDRFFKPAHAQQLARELPNARLERIEKRLQLLARGRARPARRADRRLCAGELG
jgi:hypothetical protein